MMFCVIFLVAPLLHFAFVCSFISSHLISPLHHPVTQKVIAKVTKPKAVRSCANATREDEAGSRKAQAHEAHKRQTKASGASRSLQQCSLPGHWFRPPGEGVFMLEAVLRKLRGFQRSGLRPTPSRVVRGVKDERAVRGWGAAERERAQEGRAGRMAEEQKSLEQTPTWAVALVATVFVVASLLLERGLHRLGKKLKKRNQKELLHTLEQIKNELMLLGFISLLLTVFQPRVASICMPEHLARKMLPCPYEPPVAAEPAAARRLLQTEPTTSSSCKAGYVQVISVEGLHQLHLFIFALAVIHVVYSCLTVLVGTLQVHSWKKWETEAHEDLAKVADELATKKKHHNPHEHKAHEHHSNFTQGRIKYQFLHSSTTGLNLDAYVYSFFRQFGKPIYKEDYMALRVGFIGAHQLDAKYNFHKYILRTLENDFKRVVGISAWLWAFVCIFLLINMNGWYTYLWVAFIPTILVLIVGAKLQHIIIDLAIEVRGGLKKINLDDLDDGLDKPSGVIEVQAMRPRDDLFWFSRPKILIGLIHLILFQNAFELAFFFWALFTYGFHSCLLGRTWMVIIRLCMGAFVQVVCSASTLPLFALVSQMGSTLKETVFGSEHTASAIKGWHEKAVKKQHSKGSHQAIKHRLGILGVNKETDAEGHVRDIELPAHHHNEPHGNGHGPARAHPHGHHPQHSHQQHHTHHDDSHNVEIRQAPLIIKQATESSNPREHDKEPQVLPKAAATRPSAFSNLTKMALEKEREKASGTASTQNNGP